MAYYGVSINGTNTLTQWGLILLDDLKIESPDLKSYFVDLPGADGGLDMSYALTGLPAFKNRKISFTLMAPVDDTNLDTKFAALAALCHGLKKKLWLPMDSTHYFLGTFALGDRSGFNSGQIPVTVDAYPYALKNNETTATKSHTSSTTITLTNEQRPVVPTITATRAVTLTKNGQDYSIAAGTTKVSGLVLTAGTNTITVASSGSGTLTFKYQEGRL